MRRVVGELDDDEIICPALASVATDGEYHLASYVYGILPPNVGQVVEASWGPNPDENKDLFSYDALGRPARQERYLDGHLFAVESDDYDELDRPLTFKYPDGEIVTHTYDHEGLNAVWAGPDPLVSDVWLNVRGQMTLLDREQTSGSAVDTVYTYYGQTGNFRLQTIRHGSTSDSLPDFDYGEYDLGGNILTLTTTVSSALSDTQTFEYDHHDRLVSADAMGGVANYNLDYEYDVVGNIITVTRGLTATSYIYDGQVPAQPQAVKGLQIGGQAVATYTYDLNGNMITRVVSGTASYSQTFDVQNRLVVVTDTVANETTRFFYDASGQRMKTVKPDGTVIYTPFPNYEEEHVGGVVNEPPGAPAVITQTIPSRVIIGEVGLISGTLTHANKQVTLQNSYTNPVVFARPLSSEGADASVVRITDIQSNNFTLRVQEASNHNDVHDSAESVSYLVLEAGQWILDGGRMLEVGKLNTNATVGRNLSSTWYTVTLGMGFQEAPVILSQVQTDNDADFVKTRQQGPYANSDPGDFQVALEEDEVQTTGHGTETIGWLALSPGQMGWGEQAMEVGRTGYVISDTWATVFFGPEFAEAPRLIGVLASYRGQDSATIRYDEDSLTAGSVQVYVQEDTSDDGETDHDNPDVMGYLAIEGSGVLSATKASDWITQSSGLGQPTTLASGTVIRRSTYELAGQPVALRVTTIVSGTEAESDLYHLHLDHLGSVTILSDYADGTVVSGTLALHEPFGAYRLAPAASPTDRGYTGHRENIEIGLIYMNARFYLPYINRFLTPDTIVSDPQNPQSFNRYSYALNNPIKYSDPSGHCVFAPPFDTAVCIALLALVLTGDSVQPPPPPPNYPVNEATAPCTSSLPDCFGDVVYLKDFEGFDETNPIPIGEFEEFADKVAEDLYTHDLTWPGLVSGRGGYDTPFYNNGQSERRTDEPTELWPANQQVCIETIGCSGRSDINYVAQGMWGAAVGEPEPISELIARTWKAFEYQESLSEDALFWLHYGYEYYQRWSDEQE